MASNAVALLQRPNSYIDLNELYTSKGLKFIVRRQCQYLQENPYGGLSDRIVPIMLITAGGFLGYQAATKAADQFNIEKGRPVLQGAGVVIGCGAGVYLYTQIKERSVFFKAWKDLKLQEATNACIFEKFKDDSFLNQFIDCIHYTILKVPVRLVTGHLIDLDTFYSIQPNGNGDIVCPHTRQKLDLSNPNIDFEMQSLILKRTQYLLKEEISNLDEKSPECKAAKMQLEEVENRLNKTYTKHLQGLDQLLREGKITQPECNRLRFQFYTYFGIEPSGKADLENGVEPHEMNFGLEWKKIITEHSKLIFKGTPPTQFMEEV